VQFGGGLRRLSKRLNACRTPLCRTPLRVRLLQLFGADLPAQVETRGADGRITSNLAAGRIADGGGEPGDLVAPPAAEAAPPLGHVTGNGLHPAKLHCRRRSGVDSRIRRLDAFVTDVYPGPGYERAAMSVWASTEGTGEVLGRPAASSPSPPTAGGLDDLVHPLVTEVESGGEFPQGRAAEMQATNGTVELSLGDLCGMVGLNELFLRPSGRGQQVLVHLSTVHRQ